MMPIDQEVESLWEHIRFLEGVIHEFGKHCTCGAKETICNPSK